MSLAAQIRLNKIFIEDVAMEISLIVVDGPQ